MKIVLSFLLLLIWVSAAGAAPSVIQSTLKAGSSVSSITTDPINTTSGSTIICDLTHYSNSFVSITDNDSRAWSTSVAEITSTSDSNLHLRQVYTTAIPGKSGHTFTFSISGSGYPTIACYEVSGLAATPLDQTSSAEASGTTSHNSGSTATLSTASQLVCGSGTSPDVRNFTVGGSFTEIANTSTSASTQGIIVGCKTVSSNAAVSFDFTTDFTAVSISLVSTWKAASTITARRRTVIVQ